MHILFVTDNFPPEGNAPASRTYEHAVRWVVGGHRVTVVTCAPNFPDGKVYAGYKNSFYLREVVDGIDVVRVKTFITSNEGVVLRTLDYISFMFSGFLGGLFQRKVDIVVATSPQFFTAVAGWFISVIKQCPFCFELRDIWPASISAVGAMKDSFFIRILEKIELFLYARAKIVISVTYAFRKELMARGVSGDKIKVIRNGVDSSRFHPAEKSEELLKKYNLERKFVVGYIGTHGMAHALQTVVDTAELLEDNSDIIFLFVGGGASKADLESYAKERGVNNVVFIPRQPKEMMAAIWSLCDVSLIHLKNTPLFKTVIPSKIFESMGMGLPILIGVPAGEATEIVREEKCGIIVEPENASALRDAVLRMFDSPELLEVYKKQSVRASAKYSRENAAREMLTFLEQAVR